MMRNDKKALDQTDAEKRADLFRVHLLRGRGLKEEILGSNDCTGGSTVRRSFESRNSGLTNFGFESRRLRSRAILRRFCLEIAILLSFGRTSPFSFLNTHRNMELRKNPRHSQLTSEFLTLSESLTRFAFANPGSLGEIDCCLSCVPHDSRAFWFLFGFLGRNSTHRPMKDFRL
jgi:hypothetical protein